MTSASEEELHSCPPVAWAHLRDALRYRFVTELREIVALTPRYR
jgi:hypothetical protein